MLSIEHENINLNSYVFKYKQCHNKLLHTCYEVLHNAICNSWETPLFKEIFWGIFLSVSLYYFLPKLYMSFQLSEKLPFQGHILYKRVFHQVY